MAKKPKYEFKPDKKQATFLKRLYMTRLQRLQLLKWVLLCAACVGALVIQDVIMSRIHISGATTDLAVCMILLIGLYEGTENGSLFALIASIVYLFSGSAPGPYVIALLTILGVIVAILRQSYLRYSFGSIYLGAVVAVILYEIALFLTGLFLAHTTAGAFPNFLLTGGLGAIVIPVLYPIFTAIGKIGGETWKE